jgi:hypothetical protein
MFSLLDKQNMMILEYRALISCVAVHLPTFRSIVLWEESECRLALGEDCVNVVAHHRIWGKVQQHCCEVKDENLEVKPHFDRLSLQTPNEALNWWKSHFSDTFA